MSEYPATKAWITNDPLLHTALDFLADRARSDPDLARALQMGENLARQMLRAELETAAEVMSWLYPAVPEQRTGGPYYFTTW